MDKYNDTPDLHDSGGDDDEEGDEAPALVDSRAQVVSAANAALAAQRHHQAKTAPAAPLGERVCERWSVAVPTERLRVFDHD
jgi:hypothetical protein